MPADQHDERFARSPVGLPPPVTLGGLLLDLGVEGRGMAVQRRAVARWLEAHAPAPALARALLAADLLPHVRQLVRRPALR